VNDLELLKRIPQEHYTLHEGKCMKVKDVRKIVEGIHREENKKTKRAKRAYKKPIERREKKEIG